MAETTDKYGNDFGTKREPLPGHVDPVTKPINNAELAPANPKRTSVISHPGLRAPNN